MDRHDHLSLEEWERLHGLPTYAEWTTPEAVAARGRAIQHRADASFRARVATLRAKRLRIEAKVASALAKVLRTRARAAAARARMLRAADLAAQRDPTGGLDGPPGIPGARSWKGSPRGS